jgi:hypothetical protein
MSAHERTKSARTAGLILIFAACEAAAVAQSACDPWQAWVDPVNGSDGSGAVSAPGGPVAAPFRTINAAISAIAGTFGPNDVGLVNAMPGLYTNVAPPYGNGEQFPIEMSDRIHVRGVGAKECLLRCLPAGGAPGVSVYYPYATGISVALNADVLVNFGSGSTDEESATESSIEGFTFQGADVQVYAFGEFKTIPGRVSNCVFDLITFDPESYDGDETPGTVSGAVYGPQFGVLMVNLFNMDLYQSQVNGGYYDTPLNILNNTFVQAWLTKPTVTANEDVRTAKSENVAICNVNHPLGEDPDPSQRGTANPSVQNNAIRGLPGSSLIFGHLAMLGIDAGDTAVSVGAMAGGPGATNAFDAAAVGGLSPSGTFWSDFDPAVGPPTPRVALLGSSPLPGEVDAAFVGESLLSAVSFGGSPVAPVLGVADWRILPDSPLKDAGAKPIAGFLTAANGTSYFVACPAVAWSTFDFDGEGLGNPRVVGGYVDIGYDETDVFTVTASYGNGSKSHHVPWHASIDAGGAIRRFIAPGAGAAAMIANFTPYAGLPAWTNQPGTLPAAIPIPGGFGTVGDLWLSLGGGFLNLTPAFSGGGPTFSVMSVTIANPISTAFASVGVPPSTQTFGLFVTAPWFEGMTVTFLGEQMLFNAGGSQPLFTLSNLQAEFL